ncbi:MAG: ribonuclease D [Pseudomonadota bacterium]
MNVITTTGALEDFCASACNASYLTVDTEFMREKTYFAHLCLIQAATPEASVIIDPLADDLDLSAFFSLLSEPGLVKVFHAARQDIEIFVKLTGKVPAPLFDTQVAAMVFGYGDQVGYEPLVRDLTGIQIDKGSRFTDWARRPLSDKQLDYAMGDVTHLRTVYEKLLQRLDQTGRRSWVEEEMNALLDPDLYRTLPDDAWQRLKLRNPKTRELGPILALAAWREREAQSRDIPRARILKDEAIFELARVQPETTKDLGKLRSIPQGFERSAVARDIVSAIAAGKAMAPDQLPVLERKPRESAPPDVVDLLRVLMKRQSEKHDVAPKLLAVASDLEKIALDDNADVPALRGWRREVFGDMALKLKRGEIALSLSGKRVSVRELS